MAMLGFFYGYRGERVSQTKVTTEISSPIISSITNPRRLEIFFVWPYKGNGFRRAV
jgi:hypothetical protein